MLLKFYSSMKKWFRKIRMIFNIENSLWKSNFSTLRRAGKASQEAYNPGLWLFCKTLGCRRRQLLLTLMALFYTPNFQSKKIWIFKNSYVKTTVYSEWLFSAKSLTPSYNYVLSNCQKQSWKFWKLQQPSKEQGRYQLSYWQNHVEWVRL